MKSFVLLMLAVVVQTVTVTKTGPVTGTDSSNDGIKHWAVLVAGSSEYYNYRHQADICHAYQIVKKHGIPDERIIVMMYDDIAHNDENPTKGIIINIPNGTDVYKGVTKDYTGSQVTPKNFLNVLLGNEAAMKGIGSGKVLKSGPKDHVFINFADHGAPGILAFPDDQLDVKHFVHTLKKMSKQNMFQKMVIYVEACESGSMFEDKLPNNINIYASTAANSEESSYACYWDDERETYLGDLYSVKWMEDTDAEDIVHETIHKQFTIVKKETNMSHVMQYGDMSIAKLTVSEFQGGAKLPKQFNLKSNNLTKHPFDAVPSPDVPLQILKKKLMKAPANSEISMDLQKDLFKLKKNRVYLDDKIDEIIRKSVATPEQVIYAVQQRLPLVNLDCHSEVVKYFSKNCFSLSKNDYSLRKVYILVNMCEMGIKPKTMKKSMDIVCTHPPIYGIH